MWNYDSCAPSKRTARHYKHYFVADNLRGVLPAVVKETEDQKQAILKKAEAAQKKK